jgi:hypothetical protein
MPVLLVFAMAAVDIAAIAMAAVASPVALAMPQELAAPNPTTPFILDLIGRPL